MLEEKILRAFRTALPDSGDWTEKQAQESCSNARGGAHHRRVTPKAPLRGLDLSRNFKGSKLAAAGDLRAAHVVAV